MKQITSKIKQTLPVGKKKKKLKYICLTAPVSFLFHSVIISCLNFSPVLMVSRGNTVDKISIVTGAESCCLPWR